MPSADTSTTSGTTITSFPHPKNTNDTLPLRHSPAWWRCRFLAFFSLLGEEMIGDLASARKGAREANSLLEIVAEFARTTRWQKQVVAEEAEAQKNARSLLQDKSNQQVKIAGRTVPSTMHDENASSSATSFSPAAPKNVSSSSSSSSSRKNPHTPPPIADGGSATNLFPNDKPMFEDDESADSKKAWNKCLRRIFYHSILSPEERNQHNQSIQEKMKFMQQNDNNTNSGTTKEEHEEALLNKLMPLPPTSALPSDEQMEACLRRIFWVERIAAYYVCSNVSVPRDHASVDSAVGQLLLEGYSYEEIWQRVQNKYCVYVLVDEDGKNERDDPVARAYELLNQRKTNHQHQAGKTHHQQQNSNNNSSKHQKSVRFNSNSENGVTDACTQTTSAFLGNNSNNLLSTSNNKQVDQDEVDEIAQRMMAELGSKDTSALTDIMEQQNQPTISTRQQRLSDTITAGTRNRESIDSALKSLGLPTTGNGRDNNDDPKEDDDDEDDIIAPPLPPGDEEDNSNSVNDTTNGRSPPPSFEEQSVNRDKNSNNNNNHDDELPWQQAQQQREKEKQEKDELKMAAALLAQMKATDTQEPFDATKMIKHRQLERAAAGQSHHDPSLANNSTFMPLDLKKKLQKATSVFSKMPLEGAKGGLDQLRQRTIKEEQGRRAARLQMVDPTLMISDNDDDDDMNNNSTNNKATNKKVSSSISSSYSPADLSGTSKSSYSHFNYDDFADPVSGAIPLQVIKSLSSVKKGAGEFERMVLERDREMQLELNKSYLDPYELRVKAEREQEKRDLQNSNNNNSNNNSNLHQLEIEREQNMMLNPSSSSASASAFLTSNTSNGFSAFQQSSSGVHRCNLHLSGVVKSQLISQRNMPTSALLQLVADIEEAMTRVYNRITPEGTQLNYILPNTSATSSSSSPPSSFSFVKPITHSLTDKASDPSSYYKSQNSVRALALNVLACNSGVAECVQVNIALCGKSKPMSHNLLKVCAAEVIRVLAGHQPLFPPKTTTKTNSSSNSSSSNSAVVDPIDPKPLHLRSALGYPAQDGTVSFVVHDFDASFNGIDDLINSEEKQREEQRREILQKQLSMQMPSPQRQQQDQQQQQQRSSSSNVNNNPHEYWKNRVSNFYAKYDPSKLPNVPAVLEKYQGKEEQMMESLVRKYGPEPTQTAQEIDLKKEEHTTMNASANANNSRSSSAVGQPPQQQQQQQQTASSPNAANYGASLPALKMRKLLGLPNHHYLTSREQQQQQSGSDTTSNNTNTQQLPTDRQSSVESSSSVNAAFDIDSIIQQQTSSAWKGPKVPPSKLYANKYADL